MKRVNRAVCALLLLLPISTQATTLCSPNGEPHDTAKYKDKIPKDYIAYGLLDLLNRLDLSPENKWIEKSIERARDKAAEAQSFYAKRGIQIAEAECVLGQEGQRQIEAILTASDQLEAAELASQVEADQPKFKAWISERFPSEDSLRSACVPERATSVSDWEQAQGCIDRYTQTAAEAYRHFKNDFVPFVVTDDRVSQFDNAVNAYNASNKRITADLKTRIANFTPPEFPELCMEGICLGDPISKHKDRFQSTSPREIDDMIQDGRTFCDGGIHRALVSVSGTEDLVRVHIRALMNTDGEPYIGIGSIARRVYDAPRYGHLHERFVEQVQKHFDDGYDRRSPDNHIDINPNMGPYVKVAIDPSTNERTHFVEPAKTSFCGSLEPITW